MLQLARDRLVPGKIQLNGSRQLINWQILNPEYELELAIERYFKRHALAVPWIRVQARQREGVIWRCQLMAFTGAEEEVWRLLVAAIEEWNAERDRRPREEIVEEPPQATVVVGVFKHIIDERRLSQEPPSGPAPGEHLDGKIG
jgi:hypothetical protein